jgi:hypothetical protein
MCVVVLVIQHAIRVLHIVICNLSGPKLLLYIHKGRDFRKKRNLLNLKCVFRVSLKLSSGMFIIIKRTERDVIYYIGIHVKYRFFLSDFKET